MTRPQPDVASMAVLCPVLAGLRFPVRTWHLMVAAEDYGAPAALRARLRQLPDRVFADVGEVAAVLGVPRSAARPAARPAPARHGMPA